MLVRELGEEALLERMRGLFKSRAEQLRIGIGDDAAVMVPSAGLEVWTTDLMLEGVHFRTEWQTPRELGFKSLAVNLSDLAAMGAEPKQALLSLACLPETSVEFILEICGGIQELAAATGAVIAGGDTTASTGPLVIGIAACGAVDSGGALLRSGARPGDRIFVTGDLGSAAAGFRLLEAGNASAGRYDDLRRSFVLPEPRLAAGLSARRAGVTAMTDISDGLATDLGHICRESGAGARIYADRIPINPQLKQAAGELGASALDLALRGGEDYELLFTAPPENSGDISAAVAGAGGLKVTEIGEMIPAGEGMLLDSGGGAKPLSGRGFDHFASQDISHG